MDLDLPYLQKLFGVAGIVTDAGGETRLMVCMDTDCWIWRTNEWEPGHAAVEGQKRYMNVSCHTSN